MDVRAGDILQQMINGREYSVKKDSSVTIRLSGFENETEPNGNGTLHTKQTRKLGGYEGLALSIDPSAGDLESLQEVANSGEAVPMSTTLINGTTYSGDLVIQGALDANTGDGQVEVNALGATFEQI